MEIVNTWQFNVIAYLAAVTFYLQYNKLAVKDARDNAAATLILQTVATIASALLIPFFPITFPEQLSLYGLLIAASVFYALNDRLQTPVRKHLQVSFYTIIGQLVSVFLFIYGLVIFHEAFSWTKLIGIALIISANVLLLYRRGTVQVNKYVVLAIIAAIAAATAISIDIQASQAFNLPIYIALTLLIPGLMIAVAERVSPKRMTTEYRQSNKKAYIIAGIAWAATIFFALRGLQLGEVTTVVPLQALAVVINVLVAYVFLKERAEIVKKVGVAAIIIGGVLLLTLG
jgi:drug/metabolite transporter (DMT)-like permease